MRCEIALFDAVLNSIRLGSSEKGHHPYLHTLRPHGLRMTLTLPLWTCTAIRLFAAQLLVLRSEVGSSKESTPSSSQPHRKMLRAFGPGALFLFSSAVQFVTTFNERELVSGAALPIKRWPSLEAKSKNVCTRPLTNGERKSRKRRNRARLERIWNARFFICQTKCRLPRHVCFRIVDQNLVFRFQRHRLNDG
jgi:hypothetical protein